MKAVTQWFQPGTKPKRPGVYETATEEELKVSQVYCQHWNGRVWGQSSSEPALAALSEGDASAFQRVYWRGLAEKP